MTKRLFIGSIFAILLLVSIVGAHGDKGADTENFVRTSGLQVIGVASLLLILFTSYAVLRKKEALRTNKTKMALFVALSLTTLVATGYVVGTTLYLNSVSHTGGPVHWHADFEIWNCGERVELVDAEGLSNRVGNTVLHAHGDDRMHVEGVLVDLDDASLHEFFHVIGGDMTQDSVRVPTNNGEVVLGNDFCSGQPAKLQLFAYTVINPNDKENWQFSQQKIDADYVLSGHSAVPPGDCIIIEFDVEKESTDKICETYRIAEARGDISGS